MDLVWYKGLNKYDSLYFVRVDIVSKENSPTSDNRPLSLRLLEEAPNEC